MERQAISPFKVIVSFASLQPLTATRLTTSVSGPMEAATA
jgi:hypothetical protein